MYYASAVPYMNTKAKAILHSAYWMSVPTIYAHMIPCKHKHNKFMSYM